MSDYKLVPVEPTPEMVEAAKDAYMPFGDMDLALRMALLAAPAVQGEPIGEVRFELGSPSYIFAELYSKSLPVLEPGTKLYTAPQPAEQERFKRFNGQECWMWAGDGSDRLETLTCPVVITPADLMAIINRGSPAPDVAGLVEALERLVADVDRATHVEFGGTPWLKEKMAEIDYARAALAAHRKQGGEA